MTDVDDKSPLGIKWSAIALLLGIFVAGAVSGAGICHWAVLDHGPMGHPPHGGPLSMHRDLDLTEAQAMQIEAIMSKYRPELDAVIRETFPRVKAVHEKIDREIRPLLNDEQRRRFDEMKSHRPGPGMGPPDLGGPPPYGPDRHPPGPPGDMPPPGPPGVAPPGMAMPPGAASGVVSPAPS
jgi:hypothetical protein